MSRPRPVSGTLSDSTLASGQESHRDERGANRSTAFATARKACGWRGNVQLRYCAWTSKWRSWPVWSVWPGRHWRPRLPRRLRNLYGRRGFASPGATRCRSSVRTDVRIGISGPPSSRGPPPGSSPWRAPSSRRVGGPVDKETQRETNLSAEQPAPGPQARLPESDVDPRRSRRAAQPPTEGASPTVGLIWRIRSRAELGEVARRGRRGRSGSVRVAFLASEPPPRLAFAVTRRVGSAVTRNRVRRQLRAAFRELAGLDLLPAGNYLVAAEPSIVERTYDDMYLDLRRAIAAATGSRRG